MDKDKEIEFLKSLIKGIVNLHNNIKQFTDDGTLQKRIEQVSEMLISHLRERGVEIYTFGESEQNKALKTEYIKAIFIYDELRFYHELIQKKPKDAEGLTKKYQYVKAIMLPLSLLSKNLKSWSKLTNGNAELIRLQQALREKLEFANHLRNKITGHLEKELLSNTVQWEPLIFQELSKTDKVAQRLVMYRSLLESAINSYQDEKTGRQKVFQKEIDLNLPYYAKLFFEYLYQMVDESLRYLSLLMTTTDERIKYFTGLPEDIMKAAGATDFKLKGKGR